MNVISFLNKYKYIIILLILVIYLIILCKKTEGFDNSFKQYRGLPPKSDFDSVKGKYNYIFGFHKGRGFRKKTVSKNNDLDNKISILNKLLDKLLNKFISYDQDCVGDFTKYSDCDKDCGNGKQTRQFTILKEKGKRGEDCKYDDGYTETIDCYGGICQNNDKCELNEDCIEKNCNPKTSKCEKWKPCSANRLYMCDRFTCKDLNDKNLNSSYVANGSYLWNHTDDACFFKTPAEMKTIEKNIYKYSYDDPTSSKYEGECIYYQVNDGHGKCDFRENIELGEDEKPICKKGWGPEPTTMNIKDACTCCVKDTPECPEEGAEPSIKSCMCDDGKIFSREHGEWKCISGSLTHMPEACPTYQVMHGEECSHCGPYEKWVHDDYGGHCEKCELGKTTGRHRGSDSLVAKTTESYYNSCVFDVCHHHSELLVTRSPSADGEPWPDESSDFERRVENWCKCIDSNATLTIDNSGLSCPCKPNNQRVNNRLCEPCPSDMAWDDNNLCACTAPNTILKNGTCMECGENEAAVRSEICEECTMGFPKDDGDEGCVTCGIATPVGAKWSVDVRGGLPNEVYLPNQRYLVDPSGKPFRLEFPCENGPTAQATLMRCGASTGAFAKGNDFDWTNLEVNEICAAKERAVEQDLRDLDALAGPRPASAPKQISQTVGSTVIGDLDPVAKVIYGEGGGEIVVKGAQIVANQGISQTASTVIGDLDPVAKVIYGDGKGAIVVKGAKIGADFALTKAQEAVDALGIPISLGR